MKHLYLARHAKSSWKETGLSDIERPLNERGRKDAPFMGKILVDKKVHPDLILSSPARRARKTALAIAEKLNLNSDKILLDENIYEASAGELMDIIINIEDKYNSVMIFGHNPGLTMLHNRLSNHYIDNIPTCGIIALKFNESWKNINSQLTELVFFEYPKLYYK